MNAARRKRRALLLAGNNTRRRGGPTVTFDFMALAGDAGALTVARASSATKYNAQGYVEVVGANIARTGCCDPTTLAPRGLWTEGARTNLAKYADNLSNVGSWAPLAASLVQDATIGKYGTQTMPKIVADVSNATHGYYQTQFYLEPAKKYIISFFTKAAEENTIFLRGHAAVEEWGVTNPAFFSFNMNTEVLTEYGYAVAGSATKRALPDGVWRVSACTTPTLRTTGATANGVQFILRQNGTYLPAAAGMGLYADGLQVEAVDYAVDLTGDTLAAGSTTTTINLGAAASAVDSAYVGSRIGVDVAGTWEYATVTAYVGATKIATVAALDALSAAPAAGQGYTLESTRDDKVSSFIPTTTASATRAMDDVRVNGTNFSKWFNPTEGTFIFTGLTPETPASGTGYFLVHVARSVPSGANSFEFQISKSLNGRGQSEVVVGSVTQYFYSPSGALARETWRKVGLAYKLNDMRGYQNGALGTADDGASTVPATMGQLFLGASQFASASLRGYIKSIHYYNTRVPDAIGQQVTT